MLFGVLPVADVLVREPLLHLSGHKKPAIAVRFCPQMFKLMDLANDQKPLINLPHRLVFAVATQDSVVLYDTQHAHPIAYFSNLHYATLTDVSWSHDGRYLMISSTDGFCSIACFDENELGQVFIAPVQVHLFFVGYLSID
jgi:chromatin assembly factor 1 subunit B